MCTALGAGEVIIDQLRGVGQIQWRFDTRSWLDAGPVISDSWFDDIAIDGSAATLAKVKQHLQVHRLAGDETLLDSFALLVDRYRAQVENLFASMTARGGQLSVASEVLDEVIALLGRVQPNRLTEDRRILRDAAVALEAIEPEQISLIQRVTDLEDTISLRDALDDLLGRAPALDERISLLDHQIAEAQQRRAQIDEELRLQLQRAAISDTVARDLRNANRTRERHHANLTGYLSRLSTAAAACGVEPDRQAVLKALSAAKERHAELQRQKEEADVVPILRSVLLEVSVPLGHAIDKGLGERELLEIHGEDVSVDDLANAADQRADLLARTPPPPEAAALDTEIVTSKRRVSRLEELPGLLDEVVRLDRLFQQQEERVQGLLATGALEAAKLAGELEKERAELDRHVLQATADRATAVEQRTAVGGGRSAEDLQQELDAKLRLFDISLGELGDALSASQRTLQSVSARQIALNSEVSSKRQDVSRQEAELRALVKALKNVELAWLVNASGTEPETGDTGWLAELQNRAELVSERLGAVQVELQGVAASLSAVAAEIRGREPAGTVYEDSLRDWFSDEFSRWFDQPLLRSFLFPEASDVRVDLGSRQIIWKSNGRVESRPLSAFSSGEQAFAYTQARLARLDLGDEAAKPNRLIVLDEFGSFIAGDRLQALYRVLKDRTATHPRDHVIIVLPLREDYRELAESALGARRSQLDALADQLDQSQYVVQDLTL
ncbi:hypothetical protein ACQP2Y_03780 [Actinoplanes sp. CA-051413]|uniref:hypothetical protein n=1 Tax=Actinoplanes sp. CA-051413 TaxID=3239899 RepID=UPI003D951994